MTMTYHSIFELSVAQFDDDVSVCYCTYIRTHFLNGKKVVILFCFVYVKFVDLFTYLNWKLLCKYDSYLTPLTLCLKKLIAHKAMYVGVKKIISGIEKPLLLLR